MTSPTARIITTDALSWLFESADRYPAVFTSLPDAAETGQSIEDWRSWFDVAVALTCQVVEPDGFAVFYQTDRRAHGGLQSKSHLVMEASQAVGLRVVWHKIVTSGMGTSLYRPSYTHLIAVSRRGRAGRPTPDVVAKGTKLYRDATDSAALDVGLDLMGQSDARCVLDPFCGRGSIAAATTRRGWDSISIDIDPAQTRHAVENVAAAGARVIEE